jgi:hypothetical protein
MPGYHVSNEAEAVTLSDKEDHFQPGTMSVQALIAPVVAVLLILAGVVVSVLLTGTGKQNDAEVVRSQQLVESGFQSVGRDIGRLTSSLAQSDDVVEALSAGVDQAWAAQRFAALNTGYGPVETLIVDRTGKVLFGETGESSPSLKQFVLVDVGLRNLSWAVAPCVRKCRRVYRCIGQQSGAGATA